MSQLIPLPHHLHLRFLGPDAEKYLNGQVTQQVTGLELGESRYTFICDVKGRILFDATIHRDQDGYLLSSEGADKDEFIARLDRYLIADDCELRDETEKWNLFHELTDNSEEKGLLNRFGTLGKDRYLTNEQVREASFKNLFLSEPRQQENRRLHQGVPRLPDLEGALPAETGLEELAVSFHKGCYLGQEVVSRMKRAGKTNRRLVSIRLSQRPTAYPALFSNEESPKPLLEVTSCSQEQEADGYPALGYLSSRFDGEATLTSPEGIVVTRLT